MRPITAEMHAIMTRLANENAGLGIPLDPSPTRRELVSRHLIVSRRMKAGHRSKFLLTEQGHKSLAEARVRPANEEKNDG